MIKRYTPNNVEAGFSTSAGEKAPLYSDHLCSLYSRPAAWHGTQKNVAITVVAVTASIAMPQIWHMHNKLNQCNYSKKAIPEFSFKWIT